MERDRDALNSLRPGQLIGAFEDELGASQVAIVRSGIEVPSAYGTISTVDDRLFLLSSAYVEAFVDESGTVIAYTITARGANLLEGLIVRGQSIDFGKTIMKDAASMTIAIAQACGAHVDAYWEVSGTNSAALGQTLAVGSTASGSLVSHTTGACGVSADFLPEKTFPGVVDPSGSWTITIHDIPQQFTSTFAVVRDTAVINSVTVTASGYDVIPQMISLHPMEVSAIDNGG